MRTIRNIIIKESNPEGRGAIYEIFHRLNATGVNLTAQEIRVSLNNSELMDVLVSLNANRVWRRFLGSPSPDNRMRDVEVLLRAIAMRETHDSYSPSMVRFLNGYAEQATKYDHLTVDRLESEAIIFFGALEHFDRSSFLISRRFSVPVFEAVYAAADLSGASANAGLSANSLAELANDPAFIGATTNKTTDTRNVKARIEIARGYVAAG